MSPDLVQLHENLRAAHDLFRTGQFDAALNGYDGVLALEPTLAAAHFGRGNVLQMLRRWDEALASYDQATQLDPGLAENYSNRGVALSMLGRYGDALASFDKAIALRPMYAEAYVGRGSVFKELNQLDRALASYDRAIELRANYAEAHFCRAVASLLHGDFEQGWRDFEWRGKPSIGPEPQWLGDNSIAGKTLLVYSEKGLGDTLQFCRYVKMLSELQAKVLLRVQAPLVDVLANSEGVSLLFAEGDPLPAFDYHCSLLSLPLAFKTKLDTIPTPSKYLHADASQVARWRARLGERRKPRVGLAWRGDPSNLDDGNRSMPLADLLQKLPDGFDYFSLQKDLDESEKLIVDAHPWTSNLAEELNFVATAALCECMDLVISVDTSLAHLSAALARPTWILLPFSPDCRWLLNRDDSPWYPSVKLYRQPSIGDWRGVLGRVAADLTQAFTGEAIS
jgi:lipoprotein NlpI